MTEETVVPFLRTHSFELRSGDGRRWCACVYMPGWGLDRMRPGETYSILSLMQQYGMYRREDGTPGLFLEPGESIPDEVTYLVERIG